MGILKNIKDSKKAGQPAPGKEPGPPAVTKSLKPEGPMGAPPQAAPKETKETSVEVPKPELAPRPAEAELPLSDTLRRLAPEAFVSLARAECKKHGVTSPDELLRSPALSDLMQVAVERQLLFEIFKASRPPPPPPPRSERTTVRPPPPLESQPEPVSIRVSREHITGHEETILPDMLEASSSSAASFATPSEGEVAAFLKHLASSPELTTDERLKAAKEFLDIHVQKLMKKYPKGELKPAQDSARDKYVDIMNGAQVPVSPLEERFIELFVLNDKIGELKLLAEKEREVREAKPVAPANGNGKPAPAAAPVPQAAPQEQEAAPRRASDRPSAPHPPAQVKSRLRRFFSSDVTWAAIGTAVFTGAMAYRHAFTDLAIGASRLWNRIFESSVSLSSTAAGIIYGSVLASAFAATGLLWYLRIRRRAAKYQRRAERSEQSKEMEAYVVQKLSDIALNHAKFDDQKYRIRQEMRGDEKLFACMYSLRKDPDFEDILLQARLSPGLRGVVRAELIPGVEIEIMQNKLTRFADIATDAAARLQRFIRTYEQDTVFRMVCDELLARNVNGDYMNASRAEDVFNYVENSKRQNVAKALLKGMREDYAIMNK